MHCIICKAKRATLGILGAWPLCPSLNPPMHTITISWTVLAFRYYVAIMNVCYALQRTAE